MRLLRGADGSCTPLCGSPTRPSPDFQKTLLVQINRWFPELAAVGTSSPLPAGARVPCAGFKQRRWRWPGAPVVTPAFRRKEAAPRRALGAKACLAPPVCALEVLRCSQPPEPVWITSRLGENGVWNHGYSLHPLTVRGDTGHQGAATGSPSSLSGPGAARVAITLGSPALTPPFCVKPPVLPLV